MTKRKAILLMLLVFLSGAVVGGAVTAGVIRHRVHLFFKAPPKDRSANIANRLADWLEMNESQRAAAVRIFKGHEAEAEAIHQDMKPRFDGLLDTITRELQPHLTDAQNAKLIEYVERMKNHKEGPPLPPPFLP